MQERQTLGQILIQKKLVSPRNIRRALRVQTGGKRRLGQILINMGLITDEQLFQALSDQLGIPIAQLDDGIPENILKLIPRYLCKKYGLIPFGLDEHNVLKLAMVNPLDQATHADIEAYTGMMTEPYLAKEKIVSAAIQEHMPVTLKDILHPLMYNRTARIALYLLIVLSIAVGIFAFREVRLQKYGTISGTGDLKVFSNHEMLIGVEGKGAISLIGHGPYAKGFYSVVFNTKKELLTFVEGKKDLLSKKQLEWIHWVAENKLPDNT